MADPKPKIETPKPESPELAGSELEKLKEEYRTASPKKRLEKFKVDPVTRTLRYR